MLLWHDQNSLLRIAVVLLQQGWKLLDALLRLEHRQFNGLFHLRAASSFIKAPSLAVSSPFYGWESVAWPTVSQHRDRTSIVYTWCLCVSPWMFMDVSWVTSIPLPQGPPSLNNPGDMLDPSASRYSIRGTCFTCKKGAFNDSAAKMEYHVDVVWGRVINHDKPW